ncbi:MAG: hypothetical protein FRX49_03590 [Trebouxia sp. A1-2]|nr:MAG: hypothetical protein FRX49_03590 [Trebouxia sp. A1-2]
MANITQRPHSIWLAGENTARNQLDSAFKWVMHLVIGGSEEQLAQIIQEADADLDEVITTVSQRMGKSYKVIGASAGLADHLCTIIKGNHLPALMSDLVPATSCIIAMGLLGLDLTLPGSAHAQEVAATAHDWQQLGEALSTTAASPVGSAEPSANGQSEGSLAFLLQAPARKAECWAAKQVPATEGPAASEGPTEAPAAATISRVEHRAGTEGKAAPDSPPELSVVDAEHATSASEGFDDHTAAADSPGSDDWATDSKQVPATDGPTASASLPTAAAADTTAEAGPTATAGAEPATDKVAAGTDEAAAKASTDVPPGSHCVSQHAPPAPMDSSALEPTLTAAAEATLGVAPTMTDASLDLREEEPTISVPPAMTDAFLDLGEAGAGSASEALAAGAPPGKDSEATASATISQAGPRTGTEGKAAPDSPSDLGVVDAERSTHAAEGFNANRATADSSGADVWAASPVAKMKTITTSTDPAADSEADTIAAKHAAEPDLTVPQDLPGSSSAQAYSKGSAKDKAAAQNSVKSLPTLTATATIIAGSADADVATSGSAVSASRGDDSMAALGSAGDRLDMVHPPGFAVHKPDSADVTAKSEAGLPASDQAAAKPAVPTATGSDATAGVSSPVQTAAQASLPTTTKPVSSALPVDASIGISAEAQPTACEAASSAVPASADHAAQGPVQSSATAKPGSGSKGVTKWAVHPGDHRLEWPENPVERQLSTGATAVVLRARVRAEADLAKLQPAPDMGSLTPGLDLVIKHISGMECEAVRQLTAREVMVLKAVSDKPYVPNFYGSFASEAAEEGGRVVAHSANLLIGLAAGKTVHELMGLVSTRVRRCKNDPAKLQAVREWLWPFTLHTAYGLAKILNDLHKDRSHRDVKPHNIILSQRKGKVSIKLIDFAGSRLHSEDDVLNATFSLPQAAPQLLQCFGKGKEMKAMKDEVNDIWAAATVLFQLLMSGYPEWEKQAGPFMFGPTDEDMRSFKRTDQQAWYDFGRDKIMAEQKLWAESSSFNTHSSEYPAQLAAVQELSQGLSHKSQDECRRFLVLLEGMLHPEAQERMTAKQMCSLRWLRDAAKAPLPKCPVVG